MTLYEDILSAKQEINAARKTIVCPTELAAEIVRKEIDKLGLAGLTKIVVSSVCPEDKVIMFPTNIAQNFLEKNA